MHSSQHFVTVGLRFAEAFNRADIEACVEMLHPEIEWYTSNQFLESDSHIGREDVRLYLESLHDHLDDARMEPEDGFQIGDHVMLINRIRGKGTLAGNEQPAARTTAAAAWSSRARRLMSGGCSS